MGEHNSRAQIAETIHRVLGNFLPFSLNCYSFGGWSRLNMTVLQRGSNVLVCVKCIVRAVYFQICFEIIETFQKVTSIMRHSLSCGEERRKTCAKISGIVWVDKSQLGLANGIQWQPSTNQFLHCPSNDPRNLCDQSLSPFSLHWYFSVWLVPVCFLSCGGSWLGCAVVPAMVALFESRGWLPNVEAPGYSRHPTSKTI